LIRQTMSENRKGRPNSRWQQWLKDQREAGRKFGGSTFKGKKHTEETKAKMSVNSKGKTSGKKNSQFGTCWITNGVDNKKIKKTDDIPQGWYAGRT